MNNHYYREKEPLSQRTWFVLVWLIFFWPVGLVLTWRNRRFSLSTRVIITVIVAVILIQRIMKMS